MNKLRTQRGLLCALLLALAGCASMSPKPGGRNADNIKATVARAEESYEKADWATAATAYGVLVEDLPQDTQLWFRYANALARSDQPERAVTAYREVLARDAHYAKAWFNMGIVQLRQAANSFSRMDGNISAADPLRAQSEQVHDAILRILNDDSGAKAATVSKPGSVAPSAVLSSPAREHDVDDGASH